MVDFRDDLTEMILVTRDQLSNDRSRFTDKSARLLRFLRILLRDYKVSRFRKSIRYRTEFLVSRMAKPYDSSHIGCGLNVPSCSNHVVSFHRCDAMT